ncbi:MAG: RNA methyltransferase, partial [Spirochaetales bacterium]|nr:RNA methyltransferase [Spirochaetales bacterium]
LISGAMQAGHTGVTEVLFTENVESALKLAFDGSTHLILDNVIGSESFENLSLEGKITIAIGPERGWSARERQLFTDNDYKPVLMGTRILRTETAAVAGTALTLLKMKKL